MLSFQSIMNDLLWSMKKMRPSTCTRSSQPSGNGPRLSSGGRVWLGIGLARPVRGSIHDVFFSLWSMKNMRPFGAICIVQPLGRPASKLFVICELSLFVVSSLELCLDWAAAVFEWAAVFAEPLSAASISSCFAPKKHQKKKSPLIFDLNVCSAHLITFKINC